MSRKILIPIVIFSLIIGLFVAVSGTSGEVVKAHPALTEYAAAHPDSSVRVIAFKSHPNSELAALVRSLGGEVVHDLDMINAVAANLPAGAVQEFAASRLVRWVSLDGPVESSGKPQPTAPSQPAPQNTYLDTLNVKPVWNMGLQGQGVTIVILDSGVKSGSDFSVGLGNNQKEEQSRILYKSSFTNSSSSLSEYIPATGHGTHVAGIAGGNGAASSGLYTGIAPKVNLIGLQISGSTGLSYESDVVAAMQWVYNNKAAYNIRVVNMSFNSSVESSYHTSAMSAAAEILWFNGIVVVASAGNSGLINGVNSIKASPAHDPFIITVGAMDEKGTISRSDDVLASFSASGSTLNGHAKPEIVAPGRNIISVLSSTSDWSSLYPANVVNKDYFRASGTSMSAPMVSAAAALLLQDEPNLTPDQVKFRLLNTATTVGGYKYLDVHAAVTGTTTQSANTGLTASQLLWTGSSPVSWNSVSWNSVSWNSVSWNSVSWNSVSWNSVSWNSVFFGP